MVWSLRGRRSYYYRSLRRGGKVTRQYVGGGAAGRLAAELDETDRRKRLERRDAERKYLVRLQSETEQSRQVYAEIESVLRIDLLLHGCYLRNRHSWHRRREMKPTSTAVATTRPAPLTKELMDRANAGDPAALAGLRKYLDDNPDLCQKVGNLTAHRLESLLRQLGDGTSQAALIAESVRRELSRLRKSLLPDNPLPVHELAVDRIVLAHLELLILDARQPKLTDDTVRIAVAFQRARDVAQRRYLAAMKSLATLVRLLPGKSTRSKSSTRSISAPTIKLAKIQS